MALHSRIARALRTLGRPELSVVIPCHNAEPFVESAIRSVLNQSMRDLEVIVVDDASTDHSREIVADLAARDRRVRLIPAGSRAPRRDSDRPLAPHGPGAARNVGVARARGRYLAFVDADDKVLPGAYKALLSSLQESRSDFAMGGYRRHGGGASSRPKVVARVHDHDRIGTDVTSFPEILDEPVLWNRVFRTRFWRDHVAPIPTDVNDGDQEPCLRAALAADSIDIISQDVYSWRLPESRSSRSQAKSTVPDLCDRLTVIARMRSSIDEGVPAGVVNRLLTNWVGRDLVIYAEHVPSATPEYARILREGAADLAGWIEQRDAVDQVWPQIPFQDRLLAWELALGTDHDLEEVLASRLEDTTSAPISQTRRHGRTVQDKEEPAPPQAIVQPRDLPEVGEPGPIELWATPPMLGRIEEVPDVIARIADVDLAMEVAAERIGWDGPDSVTVIGDAHVPGLPKDLREALQVELVGGDGSTEPSSSMEERSAPDANFRANDPWTDYSDTGFAAGLHLRDVEHQKVRVSTRVADRTVRAFLPIPPTTQSFRVGPVGERSQGPRFLSHADAQGLVEFQRCVYSPFRLTASHGGADSITVEITSEDPELFDPLPLVVLEPTTGSVTPESVQVQAIEGHDDVISVHVELTPMGQDRQYVGENRWRIVVILDPAARDHTGTRGSHVPVMWDKSAHLKQAAAVRAFPRSDGFAALEQRARRVTVDRVELKGALLCISGRISPRDILPGVWLVSSTGKAQGVAVPVGGGNADSAASVDPSADKQVASRGRWAVSFDLSDPSVKSGGYFLKWSLPGDEDPQGWCRSGRPVRKHDVYLEGRVRSVRVSPKLGGMVGVTISTPLDRTERTRYGRQQLLAATPPPIRQGILFESFSGKSTGDNPRAIFDDLHARGVDVPMWWSVVDGTVPVPEGAQRLVIGTRAWIQVARSARVLVTNNNFPQWFDKQPGQYFLQTWHGTPIKRLLFDAPSAFIPLTYRRLMRRQVAQWDLLLAQTPEAARDLCSSTGFDGEVRIGEQPRNVRLLGGDKRRSQVRQSLGIDRDARVVLFAPTWREQLRGRPRSLDSNTTVDPQELARELDAVVLVRGHHMNDIHASGAGVINVSAWPFVEDLMLASDVLVSDYSSIFFDWALLHRPGIVFAPDLEWYRDVERGFYGDWPRDTTWPLTRSMDQLKSRLHQAFTEVRDPVPVDSGRVTEDLWWIQQRLRQVLLVGNGRNVNVAWPTGDVRMSGWWLNKDGSRIVRAARGAGPEDTESRPQGSSL